MQKQLYRIEHRQVGTATFLSVVCKRGNLEVKSSEKVIPPILEYDNQGNYRIIGPQEVIKGLVTHPYKANSKDFNEERLADLEVAAIYKQLEHFPTLPQITENGTTETHKLAELIYSTLVYLKPTPELEEYIDKLGYVNKCKVLPPILEKLATKFKNERGINLDLHSVPKRKVGTFCYIGDQDGVSKVAKVFSFGFSKAIPCDRIARELSSLKSAERFLSPSPTPVPLLLEVAPFVTMLRVAIVGTEFSMLDSGDLYPSAIPKIAVRLSRHKTIKDVSTVPMEDRQLVYRPFRAGIEVVHQEEKFVDETEETPGTVRLILPGGVKVAAQLQDGQATDKDDLEVDAIMSFETFAKKGAVAVFAMKDPANWTKDMTLTECQEYFMSLKREKVYVNGTEYEGYIVDLPVMRPGQRYTELSKASDQITVDLIAKALLSKQYVVRPHIEDEYRKLIEFRKAVGKEIASVV